MSPKMSARLAGLVPLFLVLLGPAAIHAASPPALDRTRFIPVSEIRPGMKAVGRTVFEGRKIEEFELEIVGVLPGGRTEGDMIMARAIGPRLEHDGIAAGMSGSPIYIDGRLAGALAYGYPFSRDPICGITPIGEMLDVLAAPDASPTLGMDDVPPAALEPPSAPRPGRSDMPQLRTVLAVGGLSDVARRWLGDWADANGLVLAQAAVGAGGGDKLVGRVSGDAAREALQPGAAISVDLLRGDANASAIGTLTWRDGDRVVAFGHPLFQTGPSAYPLGLADITTIVASDLSSFKMGNPAEQVGVIAQDRRAAIAGHIGGVPDMLPLAVHVTGLGTDDRYRFEMLRHRSLAPTLVGLAAVGSLTARGALVPEATWRWKATLFARGHTPLVLEDVTSGPLGNAPNALQAPLALLLNNPFAPYLADSLTLDLDVTPGLRATSIVSATIEPRTVRPGEAARVTAEMRDYRGNTRLVHLDLVVPDTEPEGRLVVAVGGGAELDRQEAPRLPGRHRAQTLDELVERLGDRRRDDTLYASLYGAGVEGTYGGEAHPDLPGFAQRLLASDRARRPLAPFGSLDRLNEVSKTQGEPVGGLLTLTLDVKNLPRPNGFARPTSSGPAFRLPNPDTEDQP